VGNLLSRALREQTIFKVSFLELPRRKDFSNVLFYPFSTDRFLNIPDAKNKFFSSGQFVNDLLNL